MHSVTKKFKWEMAHRLVQDYPGLCKNLHGHTYECEVEIAGPIDPKLHSMVMDFGDISKTMKKWVMDHLDHATMVVTDDKVLLDFLVHTGQRHFVMPDYCANTTAEWMSSMLADVFSNIMHGLIAEGKVSGETFLQRVAVWETPTSKAEWRRGL